LKDFRDGMAELQETLKSLINSFSTVESEVKKGGGSLSKNVSNLLKALGEAYKQLEAAERELSRMGEE
ncbi:MAG: hypothetical protein ACTSWF_02030, partial [Candidatus Freyarchaeota archaeon]